MERGVVRKNLAGGLVQLALLAGGVYVVVSDEALPGASTLAKAVVLVLAVSLCLLVGEVARLRATLAALVAALRGAGMPLPSTPLPGRDDRATVDVLVRGLSSADAGVREKAHRHLVRLTGQDLPPDAAAWKAWWAEARARFPTKAGA